ncbi:hypothetical protein SAMN05660484_01196 [Eubacterium ruminantium]|uniref:DUF7601 domain-containing protein n=1 Tax=Eubacterium ruminantium TaxID=42322 RepID=A0A1T4MFE1_9FIRM|nr:hypothetical protein [Eubacterium ruminantium]SCW47641.1 hypothetical protein SAMN05660484_01196 [Eubacterium ruminantium]SDM55591.1 hypothetical protein SAMN04490370_10469 [Eubacterium ruminantium]SJZ65484.1 hypothetical protein SAMN02745110_01196 [Eubacterium ruminantium]
MIFDKSLKAGRKSGFYLLVIFMVALSVFLTDKGVLAKENECYETSTPQDATKKSDDEMKNINNEPGANNGFVTIKVSPKNFMDSWTDDTKYHFNIEFINEGNNYDFSGTTYSIDNNVYDLVRTEAASDIYKIDVDIPIDSVLTINNIPVGVHFSSADDSTARYNQIIHNGKKGSDYGNSVDWIGTADIENTLSSGTITEDFAGEWYFYLARQSSYFRIYKNIEGEANSEDKLNHFKFKLYDTIKEEFYTEPVEVDIVSEEQATSVYPGRNSVNSERVVPDENDEYEIYLRAGQVAVVGNMVHQDDIKFYLDEEEQDDIFAGGNFSAESIFVGGEGMIPAETRLIIEEDENGFYAVDYNGKAADKQEILLGGDKKGYNLLFINRRKLDGKLTIEKTVVGTNKEFEFEVILTDISTDIPFEFPAEGTDIKSVYFYKVRTVYPIDPETGETGEPVSVYSASIKLKGGEKITISKLPVGAGYYVNEVEDSAEGYYVSSEGEEGVISSEGSIAKFINEEMQNEDSNDSDDDTDNDSDKDTNVNKDSKRDIVKEIVVSETVTASKEDDIGKDTNVKTGDSMNLTLFISLTVISLIALIVLIIKKKHDSK